jgi:predicted nucleic acid-binding protein
MAVLADTGILLRLLNRDDPYRPGIREAVRTLRGRNVAVVTSPQNIAEFWNVCTRPASARGGFGLSVEETDRRVRLIERLFRVLPDDAEVYFHWRRLVTAHSVSGVQVHDARLVAFMLAHRIDRILTLNGTDFARYGGITAVAPEDAIRASSPEGEA